MGLCKCPKRKVTNLFCFEHDVNVCEYCLVSDHERCIVQSYVQWLQDSDYNPICILCKDLLKEEPTVRLICYDVFHWSCLDKYASELPVNTAPAGYQCPKCKECIFPPQNLVSPVVDALKKKLETVAWSRIGLGQSLLPIDGSFLTADETANLNIPNNITTNFNSTSENLVSSNINPNVTDDESNGFVIVNNKNKQTTEKVLNENLQVATNIDNASKTNQKSASDSSVINEKVITPNKEQLESKKTTFTSTNIPVQQSSQSFNIPMSNAMNTVVSNKSQSNQVNLDLSQVETSAQSFNRGSTGSQQNSDNYTQFYDSSIGVVLNINNLDRDTGENKYKRRPLFEWLGRFLKSRQMTHKNRLFRMTRQKKILFLIIFIFITIFTLIVIFSRLGSLSTENDPALDPMNNPNIRVQ